MDVHRQYSVARDGLIYKEMRRLGQEHFYIELIENYPCASKEELVSKMQFYIRERGALNNGTITLTTEQADVKTEILELKSMVHDMHTKINQIEDNIDALLNTVYASGVSTPISQDQEEEQEQETELNTHEKRLEAVAASSHEERLEAVAASSHEERLEVVAISIHEPRQSRALSTEVDEPRQSRALTSNEVEPTPPPSPPSPQVFQISDNEDIEVIIPHQIANYDLTEKHWVEFKGMIPDKLYEQLEKLTLVKMKAEEEYKQHPNDESRFLCLESLNQNYYALTLEAVGCYTSNRRSNHVYSDVGFDVLEHKIPTELLDKIKSLDARMHDKSDPEYGTESLSQGHEFDWSITELIEEAYNFYVLYRDKNPSDESNAKCQDLFEEWGCLPPVIQRVVRSMKTNRRRRRRRRRRIIIIRIRIRNKTSKELIPLIYTSMCILKGSVAT
jgi:hypothetical protein